MCVNVGIRIDRLDRAVFTFCMEEWISVTKMDLDKLDFSAFFRILSRDSVKNRTVYIVPKKKSMFVAESSADTCGKNHNM